MGLPRVAISGSVVALALTGCGGSKEPPPFKEVPQGATTTSGAPPASTVPGGTLTVTNLGPHYNRVFSQLIDARDALGTGAAAVTAAATDAQALADHIASGYNAPSGGATQVVGLRDALASFGTMLHSIITTNTLLPQLSTQLQLRSTQLGQRHPRQAAALRDAKQHVDTAIATVNGLDLAIAVALSKIRQQLSSAALDGSDLQAAISSATASTSAAIAKVDDALHSGFEALAAGS
jgi:hypothetical protein